MYVSTRGAHTHIHARACCLIALLLGHWTSTHLSVYYMQDRGSHPSISLQFTFFFLKLGSLFTAFHLSPQTPGPTFRAVDALRASALMGVFVLSAP